MNFGLALANGQVPGVSVNAWVTKLGNAGTTRDVQADRIASALLAGPASAQTRELLTSEVDDAAQNAVVRPVADTTRGAAMMPTAPPVDLAGLVRMAGLTIGSPEFQYR